MTTWWQFMNQLKPILCVNIMELIVFITHIWLYGRFYISEFTFLFLFPPTSVAIHGHVLCKSCCDSVGHCEWWGCWNHRGQIFIALIGRIFYCTLPRQLTLHLHRYNILRFLWGTQFWVSRSKKCIVRKWQYLVFLGTS